MPPKRNPVTVRTTTGRQLTFTWKEAAQLYICPECLGGVKVNDCGRHAEAAHFAEQPLAGPGRWLG